MVRIPRCPPKSQNWSIEDETVIEPATEVVLKSNVVLRNANKNYCSVPLSVRSCQEIARVRHCREFLSSLIVSVMRLVSE